MHIFTVDRKRWIRKPKKKGGNYMLESYLLRKSDKRMCCVGFYLKSLGLTEKDILDVKSADQINACTLPKEAKWLVANLFNPSKAALKLYHTNDNLGDELEIKRLFKQAKVQVKFVG